MEGGTLGLYGGTVKGFRKAVNVERGTYNMYGGTLTENCSHVGGGGVYVEGNEKGSGTFNLYGGKITGNKATEKHINSTGEYTDRRGGGVKVNSDGRGNSGSFTMYGGEISGNGEARNPETDEPVWRGGGVYVDGNFTMTGGKITGNTAAMFNATKWNTYDPRGGGGVYVGGSFTMTGGEISGNSLNGITPKFKFIVKGGGVYVGGKLTMSNATITDNTVTSGVGGGVFVGGTSTISNATISKNKVSYNGSLSFNGAGGGIFAYNASEIKDSRITDNHVTGLKALSINNANLCSGGGGAFLGNASKEDRSTITGCTITGNTLEGSTQSNRPNDRVGGGGVLVSKGTVTIENSTITGNSMTTTEGSSMLGGGVLYYPHYGSYTKSIVLQGDVVVKDNRSNSNVSNFYWEDPDPSSGSELTELTVTIGGALTGGVNSIGVNKPGMPGVIAMASDGNTTLTDTDAKCFFDDSGRYVARLTADGTKIQLISCPHDGGYENGICKICGEGCTHPADKANEGADETVCGVCGQQMAVKVTIGDAETYYAKTFDRINTENTLQTILNDDAITPSGSTITLLANDLWAFAFVDDGKTVTLNLNGKNLIETVSNGIAIDPGSTLTVTGTGSASRPTNLTEDDKSFVFNARGGTLVLDEHFSFSGIFSSIRVGNDYQTQTAGTLTSTNETVGAIHIGTLQINDGNAKISLKSGEFGKIIIGDRLMGVSVKAGSLLAMHYAFREADGSYVPYETVITSDKAIENVTVATCAHTGLPDNFIGTTCPYCNATLVATVSTAGKTTGYATFAAALTAANAASGCVLALLTDVGETLTVKKNVAIRLAANGHTVSGNVIVQNGANLTAIGGTFGGKVNGVGALNLTGCALTGDLSVSGNVVLDSCTVSKAVAVNKSGTLTVDGGSLTGVTVNNGGVLEFRSGNISGMVTAQSGSTVTVSNGHIDSLTALENATLILSGGNFTEIIVSGKNLIDCLSGGRAFEDTNGIVDGRTSILSNVAVVAHPTHEHRWIMATRELICACGHVKETDTTAPEITGITDGKPSYGDVTITVTDKNLATVTVDGAAVTLTDGKYTISADNASHTVVATDLAGNSTTVTATVYKVYTVTLPTGAGYTVTGASTVGHGQDYTFTVTIAAGYSATNDFMVGVKDVLSIVTSKPDRPGTYTYILPGTEVTGDLTIAVEGVADVTAPEAEISVGTKKFTSFLNTITFGLFFKKTQTVTVTATDAGSGVNKAEYLLSEKSFDEAKNVTGDWTPFNMKNGIGSFSIEPNAKGGVYVRVTDKAGNARVINSDGVVVYTDSTAVTEEISFTRLSTGNASFKVNLNGNTVKSLSINDGNTDSTLNKTLYSVGENGTITLKSGWLQTLAAGNYTITVAYNPMGESYAGNEKTQAPATTEVKLTVEKASRKSEFSASDATYNGEKYNGLYIPEKPGTTTSIEYKVKGADDSTYTTDVPKNAGSYTVRICVDADENYNHATFTKDFTIFPAKVAIIGTAVKSSKTYDGNATAEITNEGRLSVNYDGGDLTIKKGEATYNNKNVEVGKRVTFSGFELSGDAASNYELLAQPASATADITAKQLTIANLKVKDKLYDGTKTAEIDGTPSLSGVEIGDNVQLECGTPSFVTADYSDNKTPVDIVFTSFTLSGADSGNYTVAQPTGIKARIDPWTVSGDEFTTTTQEWSNQPFTVTAKDRYRLSLTGAPDGEWVASLIGEEIATDQGKHLIFYVKDTDTNVISTANDYSYRYETTAPTGTIAIRERTTVQRILNAVTFGLFFKGDVSVKITAQDDASGVKTVAYYRSDMALTSEEIENITDWTPGSQFNITALDTEQFVIYARIEDNAGNVAYLNSDRAEFDTAAPMITGVEDEGLYYVTKRVQAHDKNLQSVTVNNTPVKMDEPIELAGDTDAEYTIIATDKAGNKTVYTVTMRPISAITDAIQGLTAENVKSSDAEAIEKVAKQIQSIADESEKEVIGEEQWNKRLTASENCENLQKRIAAVTEESIRLTDLVQAMDIDKVTSADKAAIEEWIAAIATLLGGDNLTDIERAALESVKDAALALLERIADAKASAESEEITAVEKISKSQVTSGDKEALEKAEKALEDTLKGYQNNYTAEERKDLSDRLDAVRDALRALTAQNDKPASPATGDADNLVLWLALMFVGGGLTTGIAVAGKEKKQQN